MRARAGKEHRMHRWDADALALNEISGCRRPSDALLELGLRWRAGRDDVLVDHIRALKCFNLAPLRGNDEAKRYGMEI
jgi:hypothetical protein